MAINFERFALRGGWWVVAQIVLFGVIILSFTANTQPSIGAAVLGWTLIVVALVLGASGFYMLRDKLTAMPAPVDGAVLHVAGPYAIVRHPIYSAVILGFIGLSIRGANPIAFALSLLLIPFFYGKTRHEERLLVAHFPEYGEYQSRVRHRILPWLL